MAQYDLPYTGPQVEALLAKISELESEMPSKTSDLTNDSGFITSTDVPTKTSDLNNDSGFITNAPVAAEAARAQAAEALLATIASLQAEITRATGVEGTLQDLIDGIAAKIPSAATAQNQLADKSYVNASIATASATFRGTYISLVALQSVAADENDYGYVISTDSVGNTIYNRYKYANSTWTFEYAIANPVFDSSQWAAINSAITAELVAKLSALPDNATLTAALAAKQDVIDDLSSIRSKANSAYQKPSGGIPASDIADGVIPDIADNLTTNDATKALSAKQGKVLNENLTQLGQEVDGFDWTSGKYLDKYGAEQVNSDWGYSDFIHYTPGNDVIWKWGNGSAGSGKAICFYNSSKQFIASGYWQASGTAGSKTIDAAGIASDAPGAAYIRASFILADEASVTIGGIVAWENKNGLVGDVSALKGETATLDATLQQQEQNIAILNKVNNAIFLPPETEAVRGFVRWLTREIEKGSTPNKMFLIYPNGQSLLKYKVAHATNIDAAVAMYSTADLSLVGSDTFISGVQAKDGISEGILEIPSNCKLIIVGDREDILPLENVIVKTAPGEKDLRDRVVVLENNDKSLLMTQRQGIVANNPFRFDKFYAHLGIENVDSQCVIPSQSVFDIMYSKRLGFKYIEGNIRATSDGHAIVTHGNSGKFGNMFKLAPESAETDDITEIMINTKTLAWIKQNVVYNSSVPKFCVAPLTPEEFCHACKVVGILPMISVSSYDKTVYDTILGKDNYIADRLTVRGDCSAPILLYNPSLTTKAAIISACDAVGSPVGFTFSNNIGDYTDAELTEIVDAMHEKGYLVGQVCCYQNEAVTQRGWALHFDYGCSNYQVNDFGCGNLLDIDGTVDFSDFYTDGTIADGKVTIVPGQRIRPANEPNSVFIGMGMLTVKFTGSMKITMGVRMAVTVTSDGTTPMCFSTYYNQQKPTFVLNGEDNGAVIEEIHFKCSKA